MEKIKAIATGGSAADPITIGHECVVREVCNSGLFETVFWIPSGSRPDKDVAPAEHRRNMINLHFCEEFIRAQPVPLIIDFSDIDAQNTSTYLWIRQLQEQYPQYEVFWYTGVDSIVPRDDLGGMCEIEALWENGEEVMRGNMIILPRLGYPDPESLRDQLPPRFQYKALKPKKIIYGTAGSDIRERIKRNGTYEHLVDQKVYEYIEEHKLYREARG
ncbi:nicotinate-nicotinamide nucleotide adenylyltransferase [bacterium]|nr:nicotinate-nicotinamide nucleotide adenylyltransferase [bacterium]